MNNELVANAANAFNGDFVIDDGGQFVTDGRDVNINGAIITLHRTTEHLLVDLVLGDGLTGFSSQYFKKG